MKTSLANRQITIQSFRLDQPAAAAAVATTLPPSLHPATIAAAATTAPLSGAVPKKSATSTSTAAAHVTITGKGGGGSESLTRSSNASRAVISNKSVAQLPASASSGAAILRQTTKSATEIKMEPLSTTPPVTSTSVLQSSQESYFTSKDMIRV